MTDDGMAGAYSGTLEEFRRLIEELVLASEQVGDFGWQLFGIHEVKVRPSTVLMGDAEAWQAVMTYGGDRALNAPAIWRISSDGRGGEVRGYHEDSWWLSQTLEQKRGQGAWQAGRYLSPNLQVRRMLQFIWFVYELSQRFVNVARIEFVTEFGGLSERTLRDTGFGAGYGIERKATVDKRRVHIESSPEAIASDEGRVEAVARLLAPIGRLFEGWEITASTVKATLRQSFR